MLLRNSQVAKEAQGQEIYGGGKGGGEQREEAVLSQGHKATWTGKLTPKLLEDTAGAESSRDASNSEMPKDLAKFPGKARNKDKEKDKKEEKDKNKLLRPSRQHPEPGV